MITFTRYFLTLIIVPFSVLSVVIFPVTGVLKPVKEVDESFRVNGINGTKILVCRTEEKVIKMGEVVDEYMYRTYLVIPDSFTKLQFYRYERDRKGNVTFRGSRVAVLVWLLVYSASVFVFCKFSIKDFKSFLKRNKYV